MMKMAERLVLDPLVNVYLMFSLAHEFGLRETTQSERMQLSRRPLHAVLDMIVEPQDLDQLARLHLEKDAWVHQGVKGVVQVTSIQKSTNAYASLLDHPCLPRFEELRAQMDERMCNDSPIVILQIRHNSKRVATFTLPVILNLIKIEELLQLEFENAVLAIPEDTDHPSSLEFFSALEEYSLCTPSRVHNIIK